MEIVNKKLEELKPYEKNPRRNDEAVKYVANSIREFGFRIPIVIDQNNTIVAGHTRYKAAQELGLKEIPTVVADGLTEEQIKAFRIADNKTAEKSEWDNDLLGQELNDILDRFDMTEFGFGDFELTMLTEDFEPEPYDEEVLEKYGNREQDYLQKKRVIITYEDDEEEKVMKLLGVERLEKVVYDIGEL